ncbi:MAG: hypothetical protein JXR96_31090, partial [Deltaproteobacteria bacterium]|nr:hypothetical protein [Deltaproteobacteria bacterium]
TSGQERMIDDLTHVMTAPMDFGYEFHFDGHWAVMWMGSAIGAYDVDSGRFEEVTRCSAGDCHTYYGDGIVAFDRSGDDGLDQHQLFVYSLESGAEEQLTFLRPYYDVAIPQSMLGRRLLWSEGRGKAIADLCGNKREPTGRTALYFWKDIELD